GELLIIYETEAEQWATYLHSVFTGPISEAGICCYDIASAPAGRRLDDFSRLAEYTCKLLILSKGMLEVLSQMQRFFLARVLSPAAHVVVLLCGVESLTPLLELVPLNADECLQISSEQDAHEYLSAVTDIVKKGMALVQEMCRQSTEAHTSTALITLQFTVLNSWQSSMEVFILLKNEAAGSDTEVEFTGENQTVRVKPVRWNEQILCINAPDFPGGNVGVTVYINGVPLSKAQLQYYTNMEEITCLLARAADPVDFMCQAFQESSVERLDQKLSSMLLEGMPTGGFQGLNKLHHAEVPTLLHFAAQYGLKRVSSLLLQCPGAERALRTANCHRQTPAEIAKHQGHTELHVLLKETLVTISLWTICNSHPIHRVFILLALHISLQLEFILEEEEIYAPLEVNDEYDSMLNSTNAVVIANRPPAPTPRPESSHVKEDRTPYITKDACFFFFYCVSKAARGREDSISSTYDTFLPNQGNGLQPLTELQQRVKAGSLTVDGNLERSSDLQRGQKAVDNIQEKYNKFWRYGLYGLLYNGTSCFQACDVMIVCAITLFFIPSQALTALESVSV
uniref:B cell scaffold protein with ankyrin repeats 1 n=1 Tax=Labrus bergylta TaxID=56723 RepID=A0A3Q3NQM9_9LABR